MNPIDPEWVSYAAELGRNLQRERLSRGKSQERVAYQAGLSRYTYQKYEKGESKPGVPANPSLKILLAICQSIEVTLDQVLPGEIPDLRAR